MYHYVYMLEFDNGKGYIGLHSTKIRPELDECYLGSGKGLPPRDRFSCKKIILETFPSREAAAAYEVALIELNDCVSSEDWYNLRKRTFDKHGTSLSPEHRLLISQTHTGRKRKSYALKYKGAGRTPAQQAGNKAAGEKLRGTKCPAKGAHEIGIDNNGFRPWYYITPSGDYIEVHDITKQDYARRLGFSARQLGHRFHHTNEHKPGRYKMFKGWIFGNLPRPPSVGED